MKIHCKRTKIERQSLKKILSNPLRGNETLRQRDFTSRNLPSLATSWPHKYQVLLSQQRASGTRFLGRKLAEFGTKSKDFSESLGVPPGHCAL